MLCPKNSHYELCGRRCPVVCAGLSSPSNCSGGCEEGCQCDPGYVLSDDQCVPISDCGCMHEGQYHASGVSYTGKDCQRCVCSNKELTCSPSPCQPTESYSVPPPQYKPLRYGVCEVFAGFGYKTFDDLVLPHHGACTYLVSALSSEAMHDYSLLLSFEKDTDNSAFTISRLRLNLLSMAVSIEPRTLWKIRVSSAF